MHRQRIHNGLQVLVDYGHLHCFLPKPASPVRQPLSYPFCYVLALRPDGRRGDWRVRLLHTADWHLGHTLLDLSREYEHQRFLAWLLDLLGAEEVDALLVAGDIFDSANPSSSAQSAWYEFIAQARQRYPRLDLVFVAGNHDSAGRLEAPSPLLQAFNVHVIGSLPRLDTDGFDLKRVIVPLTNAQGEVAAWCAAVPFLRPVDLPVPGVEPKPGGDRGRSNGDRSSPEDPLVDGVREIYRQILREAERKRRPGQALVATGHAYTVGGRLSELSERRILGGNQHALPHEVFAGEFAYVALGHLHLAQKVDRGGRIRYAGSPLPLAVDEASYPHQVALVELDGPSLASVREIRVPRSVEILRVPKDGAKPLSEVLADLARMELPDMAADDPRRPFLEVRVRLDKPEPALRRRVEEALDGKPVRLVRITPEWRMDGMPLAEDARAQQLRDLRPEDVFRSCWNRDHEGEPPPELIAAFYQLVEAAEAEEGGR